jgi:hypothetical protein
LFTAGWHEYAALGWPGNYNLVAYKIFDAAGILLVLVVFAY